MIGQGLLLLVIPAVALHLMVLVLESNSSITRVAQHELLRRLRVWFLIFAFIGLCLCLISTPLIVMAPFILTGILMAMKI